MKDTGVAAFLESHRREVEPIGRESGLAWWNLATTGLKKWEKKSAELGKKEAAIYSDAAGFEKLTGWRKAPPRDVKTARVLERTWRAFLRERKSPALVKKIVNLEVEVQGIYNNFRSTLGGKKVGDNVIANVLQSSADLKERRAAWEASKQIGGAVHGKVRELARLRNENARAGGFPDYYRMALAGQEIEPDELWRILDDLERRTEKPWRAL